MKNLLFISCLVLTAGITWSQKALQTIQKFKPGKDDVVHHQKDGGDIIWENDFSNPEDWTIGTDGQGTFIIGTNTHPEIAGQSGVGGYMGTMSATETSAANGYAFFNGVQYLLAGEVDPQDTWVQSDTIDLSGYASNYISLSFNQRFRHLNYDSTSFEVSEDAGQTWVSYAVNLGIVTNDPAIQNTIFKLIPVNQSAETMIRFRWRSSSDDDLYGSGYGWMVDDVKLIEPFVDEVKIEKTYTNDVINAYDYYSTPLSQVAPQKYGAIIENLGSNITSKYVKFSVSRSGTNVYLDSVLVDLNPGQIDTIWVENNYTPDEIDSYSLDVYTEDDGVQTNNMLSDEFVITQNIYGHNYPITGNTTFQFNTEDAFLGMGNVYECFQNQEVYGIQFAFGPQTTSNTEIEVEIREVISGIQDLEYVNAVFYTTPEVVETNLPVNIVFDSPINLEAGKTYVALVKWFQSATSKIEIRSTSKGNEDFSTIGYGPFGQNGAENYFVGWSTAPHISLNFDPTLDVEEINTSFSLGELVPNPVVNETSLKVHTNNPQDLLTTITDFTGRTVLTQKDKTNQGENKITLDTKQLSSGIYTVTLSSGATSFSRKMIVQ